MPVLEVKNLTKEFRYSTGIFLPVISDVSFRIEKNERVGLLGKIGSGKSTIGLSILRLLEPVSGEIYYNNKRVDNISKKAFRSYRKQFQIIFQDSSSSLNPVYTVDEQLKELFLFHKLCGRDSVDKHVDNSLSETGLKPEIKTKYPHELSTGEKQRVCIARALISNPEFIVLDEITSSLDVVNEKIIIDLLIEIQKKRSISYMLITHDIKLALFFCNRIMLINNGKLVEIEDKSEDKISEYFKS